MGSAGGAGAPHQPRAELVDPLGLSEVPGDVPDNKESDDGSDSSESGASDSVVITGKGRKAAAAAVLAATGAPHPGGKGGAGRQDV